MDDIVFADRTTDSASFDIRSANFEKEAEKDIERLLQYQYELLYSDENQQRKDPNKEQPIKQKQREKKRNPYRNYRHDSRYRDEVEVYGEEDDDEDEEDYILEIKRSQLNDYCQEWKQTTAHLGILGQGFTNHTQTEATATTTTKRKMEGMTVAQRLKQFQQQQQQNKISLAKVDEVSSNAFYEESIFGGRVEETIESSGHFEETICVNHNMQEPTPPSSITKWMLVHSGLPSYDPVLFQSMQIVDELFEHVWVELVPMLAALIPLPNKRSNDMLDSPLSESGMSLISSIASDDGINTIKVIPERSVVAMIPQKNAVNQNIDYGLSNSISIKTYKTFFNSRFESLYQHDDFFYSKTPTTTKKKKSKKRTVTTPSTSTNVASSGTTNATMNTMTTTKTIKRKAKSTKRKVIKKGTSALEMYQFNARPRSVHSRQNNNMRDGFFPARRANLYTSAGFRFAANKKGTLKKPTPPPPPPQKLPLMKPRHLPTSVVVKKPSTRPIRSPPRPRSRSYSSSLFQGFTQAFHP